MHDAQEVVRYPLPYAMAATMVIIGAVGLPLWIIPFGTVGFVVACMPAFRPTLVQARATRSVVVVAVIWSGVVGMALILTAITYLLGFAIGSHLNS